MSNPNQGAATRARNEEIERRLTAGESGPTLAKEFGVTQPRVHQIARAVREARGELTPRPKRSAPVLPRLRKVAGVWECGDGVVTRSGDSPKAAYDVWALGASADAQPTRKGQQDAVPEPEKPYTGPVTIVSGTKAAPKPFVLSPAMAILAQRAREAQIPMRSLAGIRERAA
ncbi:hypothetical protein [Achromobacter piechaudii]|uniref:hypothetical protein n=1 Tax=Achromobacter piechaudii TaxID=72556 RepID=UPI001467DB60|nr:hypothetical protein [Achromobacter piechaudii]CAB3952743.1 hypothetical protein LMG6103_03544 [Achromobacter piechaudii]